MVSNTKILITEDEAIVAKDLESQVLQFGYQVVGIAATGQEAVKLAEQHKPDVVLMDIKLKGPMDGIEAAMEIRRQQGCGIVYVTAHTDRMTTWRSAATYPSSYVLKPFDERSLRTAITVALVQRMISAPVDKAKEKPSETAQFMALSQIMRDHIADDFLMLEDFENLQNLLARFLADSKSTISQINSVLDGIMSRSIQFREP